MESGAQWLQEYEKSYEKDQRKLKNQTNKKPSNLRKSQTQEINKLQAKIGESQTNNYAQTKYQTSEPDTTTIKIPRTIITDKIKRYMKNKQNSKRTKILVNQTKFYQLEHYEHEMPVNRISNHNRNTSIPNGNCIFRTRIKHHP